MNIDQKFEQVKESQKELVRQKGAVRCSFSEFIEGEWKDHLLDVNEVPKFLHEKGSEAILVGTYPVLEGHQGKPAFEVVMLTSTREEVIMVIIEKAEGEISFTEVIPELDLPLIQ